MPFRLQYVSNLCLPIMKLSSKPFTLPVAAPTLALLGNVGLPECPRTKDFFQWADESYEQVFWIPGSLEYSSNHSTRCAWNERADACYDAIREWKLNHTSFCQKMNVRIPFSTLTLLATPGGLVYNSSIKHFRWDTSGDYVDVEQSEYARFQNNEHSWIENSLIQTQGPIAVLSHRGVSLSLLQRYNVVANCFGIKQDGGMESSTGGQPWTAINMAGHNKFRPSAVFEFDSIAYMKQQQERKSDAKYDSSSIDMR